MTVHKISAGDGYTYLTWQVASADERRSAGQALADYYTAHAAPPGVWLGLVGRTNQLDSLLAELGWVLARTGPHYGQPSFGQRPT